MSTKSGPLTRKTNPCLTEIGPDYPLGGEITYLVPTNERVRVNNRIQSNYLPRYLKEEDPISASGRPVKLFPEID
jgi:hypothetical protein